MPTPAHFAERVGRAVPGILRSRREALGLSGYALAERSGVSRDMIRRIEAGETNPTLFIVARLIRAMNMSFEEFAAQLDPPAKSS